MPWWLRTTIELREVHLARPLCAEVDAVFGAIALHPTGFAMGGAHCTVAEGFGEVDFNDDMGDGDMPTPEALRCNCIAPYEVAGLLLRGGPSRRRSSTSPAACAATRSVRMRSGSASGETLSTM